MGTEKRQRQKVGRQVRAEAEIAAARRAKMRRTVVRVAIAVVVILAALFAYSLLRGNDSSGSETVAETTTTTLPETTTTLPETTTTSYSNPALAETVLARSAPDPAPPPADTSADALEIKTLIGGEGAGAAPGDVLTVHYVGKTPDGNVFDESWSRGQPITLPLGQGGVIAGWDEGLVGAKIGERRRLVIGSDKAYGPTGNPPAIPPSSPLAFEVDIVDITPAPAGSSTSPPSAG